MAYIDKELFKQNIKMRYCNNCANPNEIKCRACHVDDMLGEIEEAPTADVAEVKHGEWIKHRRNIPKMREFHEKGMGLHMSVKSVFWACSCCGQWGSPHNKYCSVCGAKMDGRSDNECHK